MTPASDDATRRLRNFSASGNIGADDAGVSRFLTVSSRGPQQYFDWFIYELWRFMFVQKQVAKLAMTAIEYPPMLPIRRLRGHDATWAAAFVPARRPRMSTHPARAVPRLLFHRPKPPSWHPGLLASRLQTSSRAAARRSVLRGRGSRFAMFTPHAPPAGVRSLRPRDSSSASWGSPRRPGSPWPAP